MANGENKNYHLLENSQVDLNQTCQESSLGEGDLKLFKWGTWTTGGPGAGGGGGGQRGKYQLSSSS